MKVQRIDHVQLAMPVGGEAEAIAFYEGVLGIPNVPKPPHLAGRGGCWFEDGDLKVHLGVEDDFRPARKAHPALVVDQLSDLEAALAAVEATVTPGDDDDRGRQVYVDDPFGNRLELIEPR